MIMIERIKIGKLLTNCYIIHNNKDCIIIDPAGNYKKIIDYLTNLQLNIDAVFITHAHFDHVLAVGDLQKHCTCPIYIHELERKELCHPIQIFAPIECSNDDLKPIIVTHNQLIDTKVGQFKILHTPGHSDGSLCFLIEHHLFTGDTLFKDTIGRTDFDRSNHYDMINSIQNILYQLANDTIVYPGHGDFSTIGYEKIHNQAIKAL